MLSIEFISHLKKPRKCKNIKIPKLEQEAEYLLILGPHWSRHPQNMLINNSWIFPVQINCDNLVQPKAEVLTTSWRLSCMHVWGVLWAHTSVCIKYQHLWAERQHTAMLWLLWENRGNITVLIMTFFQPASVWQPVRSVAFSRTAGFSQLAEVNTHTGLSSLLVWKLLFLLSLSRASPLHSRTALWASSRALAWSIFFNDKKQLQMGQKGE